MAAIGTFGRIKVPAGSLSTHTVTFTEGGVAMDFTGKRLSLQIKQGPGVTKDSDNGISLTDNTATVTFTHAETGEGTTLAAGTYDAEFWVDEAGANRRLIATGTVEVYKTAGWAA